MSPVGWAGPAGGAVALVATPGPAWIAAALVAALVGVTAAGWRRHRGRRFESGARWLRPPAAGAWPAPTWALIAVVWPAAVVVFGLGRVGLASLLGAGAVALRAGRRRAAVEADRARSLPELVELFQLAASAGHPVPASLRAVAERAPPALRGAVGDALRTFDRGVPLDGALTVLGDGVGPAGQDLVAALRRAAATGAHVTQLLESVAAGARDQRLRDAQVAARRLPVTMLLPLAACTLPAAVVLAVVPVLAVSLDAVHL